MNKVHFLSKYSDFSEYHGSQKYNELFFETLASRLAKNYGERECNEILKSIGAKRLIIRNRKSFFRTYYGIQDVSDKAFKDCSNDFDFFSKLSLNCKKELEEGLDQVVLTLFPIYVTSFAYKNKSKKENTYTYILLKQFLADLCTPSKENSIVIRILDAKLYRIIMKELGIKVPFNKYINTICTMLNFMEELLKSGSITLPTIEYLRGVYNNYRLNQVSYLSSIFSIPSKEVKEIIKDVDLSVDSSARDNILFYLKNNSKFWREDLIPIKKELARISEKNSLKTYYLEHDISEELHLIGGLKRSTISKLGIKLVFTPAYQITDILKPSSSIIEINCKKIKDLDSLDILLSQAFKISALNNKNISALKQYPVRIILKDLEQFSEDTIKEIYYKKDKLESLVNGEILLQIEFDPKVARNKAGQGYPTHIRIISDIHCDINESKGYYFNFEDDYVVNCGDTSGDCVTTANWIKSNVRQGVFVHGNHLGYNQAFPELNGPQNMEKHNSYMSRGNTQGGQSLYFSHIFGENSDVRYLEGGIHEFNGIYFLGGCLYTNFMLYGESRACDCKNIAKHSLNDFRYVYKYFEYDHVQDPDDPTLWRKIEIETPSIRPMNPDCYVRNFYRTIYSFEEKLLGIGNKPVVVVTHFAPSIHSVAPMYKNDPLSAAFAVNMENFITKHPNIRLWCHGHVHNYNDYILGTTRVISCPWGYYNENNVCQDTYGKRISFEDLKSKKPWEEILANEIEKGDIKIYKFLPLDEE